MPLSFNSKAQTAIEYLLLLTITAIIALAGLVPILTKTSEVSGNFYKKAAIGIMGCGETPITCVNQNKECGEITNECLEVVNCSSVCTGKGGRWRCDPDLVCRCYPLDPIIACDGGNTCQKRGNGCGSPIYCADLCAQRRGTCVMPGNVCVAPDPIIVPDPD